jgi:lipid II:glycine glycyltransferase (peptidoglycan interpeptide bridge formation enzyme)
MHQFQISTLSKDKWDDIIINSNGDYRQFYEWGELKKKFGWEVLRLELKKDSEIKSTCQLLVKKKWFLLFIYFAGSINGEQKYLYELLDFIKNFRNKNYLKYFRIDLTVKKNDEINQLLKKNNLYKTLYKRSGNTQIECDLNPSIENILKNCDRKWRYNYNRALKNPINIKVIANPDVNLIYKLSKDLEKEKKLGKGHSHEEVTNIFNNLEKNIIYLQANDKDGKILGFRAALFNKTRAWDFFAVSTKLGRAYKAGYPLMIDTIKEAQKKGIKKYYFVGDDPINMEGVFNFKKGLNGEITEYVGEIEWSNFFILKYLFNLIIYLLYSDILPKKFQRH